MLAISRRVRRPQMSCGLRTQKESETRQREWLVHKNWLACGRGPPVNYRYFVQLGYPCRSAFSCREASYRRPAPLNATAGGLGRPGQRAGPGRVRDHAQEFVTSSFCMAPFYWHCCQPVEWTVSDVREDNGMSCVDTTAGISRLSLIKLMNFERRSLAKPWSLMKIKMMICS